jgi:hypothetical protein
MSENSVNYFKRQISVIDVFKNRACSWFPTLEEQIIHTLWGFTHELYSRGYTTPLH